MWGLLIQAGISLGALGVNWLYKKLHERPFPKPRIDDLDFPQTEIGSPYPIIYGTIRVDEPVIHWSGEYGGTVSAYACSVLHCIGIPPWDEAGAPWSDWRVTTPPRLENLWFGDQTMFSGPNPLPLTHGEFDTPFRTIDGLSVIFIAEFFDGRSNQLITSYPAAVEATTSKIDGAFIRTGVNRALVPGYRHQMLGALVAPEGSFTIGRDPQLRALAWEVSAVGPESWNGIDANPAWVIYDLLCGKVWKLGISQDRVDLTSFEAAADTLVEEEHGISLVIYQHDDAISILSSICEQINASLFEDPSNGKIKIKLIRADYDPDTIPVVDEDNTIGKPQIKSTGWTDVVTQLSVSFTNRSIKYKRDTVQAPRLANVFGNNRRRREKTMHYPGCMTVELAKKLVARDMGLLGRPVMGGTWPLSRAMHALRPGDVFKGSASKYNITERVWRVVSLDHGQLAKGVIVATVIEDVFGQTLGATGPTPVEPALPYLLPIHERLITETPAWMQQRLYDAGVLTATSSSPLAYAFAVAANTDDAYAQSFKTLGTSPFVPGVLSEDKPASNEWLKHATVKTEYPRSADPYDTTVGLELEGVSTALDSVLTTLAASSELSDSDVAVYASSLSVLYDPETQAHEFIAFKTCATITGGWEL
ncbi:MAG: phage tail protein, partial [Kofleriaceae bacterium]